VEVVDDGVAPQTLVVAFEIVPELLQEGRKVPGLAAAEVTRDDRRRPCGIFGMPTHASVQVLERAERAEGRDDVIPRRHNTEPPPSRAAYFDKR
jgi:hypothetical protein